MRNTLLILGISLAALLPITATAQSTTNEFSVRFRWEQPPADVEMTRLYAGKATNEFTHVKAVGRTNEMSAILPSGGTWYFAMTHQNTNKMEGPFSDTLAYTFGATFPGAPRNAVVIGGFIKQIISITNLTTLP